MNNRQRKTIRHQRWHYDRSGFYFITICTHQRDHLFDNSEFKAVAEAYWQKIPGYKSVTRVSLDVWVVMPNHLHGILVIENEKALADQRPEKTVSGSVGALIGAYKSTVTKRINKLQGSQGIKVWQRGYYDHIIRNEQELHAIRQYIIDNPKRWAEDRENLDAITNKMTHRGT